METNSYGDLLCLLAFSVGVIVLKFIHRSVLHHKVHLFISFVCVWGGHNWHGYVWKSEDNLKETVPSSHQMGPGD